MESVYLGFEELFVDGDSHFASEAVISSVIPLDGELLIVGNVDTIKQWRSVCYNLSIPASIIDTEGTSVDILTALEAILKSNTRISHIIANSDKSNALIASLGMMARKYKRSFILVDNADNATTIDMNQLNIDFLICADGKIVARRNRLVQTEGNARVSAHDIYALWQRSMINRRATLEPMAC